MKFKHTHTHTQNQNLILLRIPQYKGLAKSRSKGKKIIKI